MICMQLPAPRPQRHLVYQGKMTAMEATEKFRNKLPLNSEINETIRQSSIYVDLAIASARIGASLIATGTYLLHPGRNEPFPALFELMDGKSGKTLCADTRSRKGERGLAVVMKGSEFGLGVNGIRTRFIPTAQPTILRAFPQYRGHYSCEAGTIICVEDDPSTGQALTPVKLFLDRRDTAWMGMVLRSLNEGDGEEKILYVSGSLFDEVAVFTWEQIPIVLDGASGPRKVTIHLGGTSRPAHERMEQEAAKTPGIRALVTASPFDFPTTNPKPTS